MRRRSRRKRRQIGNGDGLRRTLLFGLFRELVNLASNQDRPYRGYMLDAEMRPATVRYLAKVMRWPITEMKKGLAEIAGAGLIERVAEPDYLEEDERSLLRAAPQPPRNSAAGYWRKKTESIQERVTGDFVSLKGNGSRAKRTNHPKREGKPNGKSTLGPPLPRPPPKNP
jgi:hypothetical protein